MVITLELWPTRGRNRTGVRTVLASELTDGQWSLIKDLFVERPTGGRPTALSGRHPVGAQVRRSLAGFTNALSLVLHMLATIERVDGFRDL